MEVDIGEALSNYDLALNSSFPSEGQVSRQGLVRTWYDPGVLNPTCISRLALKRLAGLLPLAAHGSWSV